jgi:hypothetical protein
MINQDIIWTALPNGYSGEHIRLSVFVSPRLHTDENLPHPELGQFPDFAAWHKHVAGLRFVVETNSGNQVDAAPDLSAFDESLWRDLFHDDTFVRPYQFPDYQQRAIRTYPVRSTLAYLKNVYQIAGESSPDELPGHPASSRSNPALVQLARDLGMLLDERFRKQVAYVDNYLKEVKVAPPGQRLPAFSSQVVQDFYQAQRFYDRPGNQDAYRREPKPSLAPPELKEPPELDFHQALAILGDQPALLRKLGIVLDLLIPRHDLTLDDGAQMIRVHPQWGEAPASFSKDFTPWTRFNADQQSFTAAAKDPTELAGGYVRLEEVNDQLDREDAVYDLIQVDPDGLAIKAINFAGTLYSLTRKIDSRRASFDTPDGMGLPSIQSGGLALARFGRAARLHQHFQQSAKLNQDLLNGMDVAFFAEDVLRGYRVDVRDDASGEWRSLCQRAGSYTFPDVPRPPLPFEDEGYLKGASTTSADDQSSDLYFHETMFRWAGWSLVAERPGKTIQRKLDENTGEYQETPERVKNQAAKEFRLEVDVTAKPGSLPRLRFGRSYQVRLRAADLAGNSLDADDQNDAHASEKVTYLRFEPLSQPTLAPRTHFTEGESVERMVIRSNYHQTASEYVNDATVIEATQGKPYTYLDHNERHVVPPKTSQLMAETHGMFDPFFAPGLYQSGYNIAVKEEGTLADSAIVDTTTGQKVPLMPNPIVVVEPANPADPGAYILHTEEQLQLPYLPDPLGRGAALRDLPGHQAGGTPGLQSIIDPSLKLDILQAPFELNWPNALPFRMRIAERPGKVNPGECHVTFENAADPPHWDAGQRLLTVYLPKATIASVRYSSYMNPEDVDLMGVWRWLESSPHRDRLRRYAVAGAHWMFTPDRELVLVHAVQQPLCEPVIQSLNATRAIGETFTRLSGKLLLSAKSTGQIDVEAAWEQWVDNPAEDGPQRLASQAHAFERRVEYHEPDDLPLKGSHRHEFGDTRHRMVDYHVVGATRFREYFAPEITADPAQITRRGPVFKLNVPSSARPASPRVVYMLPTFTWQEQVQQGENGVWQALERTRLGNGLRVYLERPWYSSGDGELLGVVMWPFQWAGYGNKQRLISLMGMDPVHFSNQPNALISAQDFSNVADARGGLSLAEDPFAFKFLKIPVGYAVAGFEVAYNNERKLWYADLQFNSQRVTSYYPFVRLALARYQPNSIPDAHLSPVILTDFMQLAPDRHLAARWIDAHTLYLQVSGYAPVDRAHNSMDVTIQVHDAAIPGELGWTAVDMAGQSNPLPLLKRPLNMQQNLYRWDNRVVLPFERGAQPLRLLVKEYETYRADSRSGVERRVVYADTIAL